MGDVLSTDIMSLWDMDLGGWCPFYRCNVPLGHGFGWVVSFLPTLCPSGTRIEVGDVHSTDIMSLWDMDLGG